MLSTRRAYTDWDDTKFFKMNDVWEFLCQECEDEEQKQKLRMKVFAASKDDPSANSAGVVAFNGSSTLVVSSAMLERAKAGHPLANFQLAHELAHLVLDHHKVSATVKQFRLTKRANVNVVSPPNEEELEANFAAVSFQCGVLLLMPNPDPKYISRRAHCDEYQVAQAVKFTSLDVFRNELARQSQGIERIIL
jgi:Zn-dependent peptidase ImmA (M78 family)